MIEVSQLTKYYSGQVALNNINFGVPPGALVGVAGSNGAGKSTLFDILTTLDRSYQGKVLIGGMDNKDEYRKIRSLIGYVPGTFSLYNDLTVLENISFIAGMYGSDLDYLAGSVFWNSLKDFSGRLTGLLSGGMKQKLAIICAMVHSPRVLFLDEPTTGIDPGSRESIWEELSRMRDNGVTIIASTHYYEELNYVDRLLFMHEGNQLFYKVLANIKGEGHLSGHFFEELLNHALVDFLKDNKING